MQEFYEKTKCKVFVCNNEKELKDRYFEASRIIDPSEIIIQEIIPGSADNLYSFGSFFKDGKQAIYVIGRRSRQIPMDFGKASTFVELVEIPRVRDLSLKFLEYLKYYGLSEVEFKYDARDGEYKLLEINPRTWKWHSIASQSGFNLPYSLYCDILGIDDGQSRIKNNKMNDIKWMDPYTDLYVSAR
jgi:D-aspartate ligase